MKENKLFTCNDCKGAYFFTEDIKKYNYLAGHGFICNNCHAEREDHKADELYNCHNE